MVSSDHISHLLWGTTFRSEEMILPAIGSASNWGGGGYDSFNPSLILNLKHPSNFKRHQTQTLNRF